MYKTPTGRLDQIKIFGIIWLVEDGLETFRRPDENNILIKR